MIFVAICSYRDSELEHTIADAIKKAKWPADLRFGVVTQGWEGCGFPQDDRFRLIGCEWWEARGLGWARAQAQTLYDGEEFALQLDSHHRFEKHWDAKLIKMLEQTGSAKPMLGSYAGTYEPLNRRKKWDRVPYKMIAWEFSPYGTIKFRPGYIQNWRELNSPIPARFMSGHFFFSLGKWHEEYKFDPEIFFAGEEISMAIRSWTMGWDLFHPHRTVVFHEYLRKHRVKVWEEHTKEAKEAGQIAATQGRRQEISAKRIRKLLREEDNDEILGQFDLGTVRTHREYELYAGVNFAERTLTREAMQGTNPPTNKDGTEPDENLLDTYVALEDRKGKVLEKKFWPAGEEPFKLVVWPRLKDGTWGKRKDTILK